MAKESKDKTSTAVLQYFMMQNRPFAINDLLQSAQLKDFGKAAVQKTLDQLVVVWRITFSQFDFFYCKIFCCCMQAEKIKEKTYGKQKVYVIDQDLVSSPDDVSNIAQMDTKISELTRQNAEDETFIRNAETELKNLNSKLSIAEATSKLQKVFVF